MVNTQSTHNNNLPNYPQNYIIKLALVDKYINYYGQKAKITNKLLDDQNTEMVVILTHDSKFVPVTLAFALLNLNKDQLPLINPLNNTIINL